MENFSKNKLEDMMVAFNLFDLDGDGKISKYELKEGLKILNLELSNNDIDDIIKNINGNDDFIEFEDFIFLFVDKKEYKQDEALFDAFKIFGKKNNGNITLEQMKYLINTFCNTISREEKELIILELYKECEESVSFEAFCKVFNFK
jgi:Ca2+-binding EF-hand superfamily protein